MKAMILAAGRGTRMGALTDARPKPLLEIGGESLLERQVRLLAAAGFRDLVINVSYNAPLIRETIGDGSRWGASVRYSVEGDDPLETGGGIVQALPLLGSDAFLVVNADVLTDFPFASLQLPAGRGVLVLVPNPAHNAAGDFGLDALSRIVAAPPKLTFAGISILDRALFDGLPVGKRALKPILDAAAARGELYGRRYEGLWIDVGTPERLTLARQKVAELE